jgi:large subunit ribosomal protein L10
MAITKKQKSTLITSYGEDLAGAKNIVLVKQSGVSVNNSNTLRMAVAEAGGKLNVVRKRLFIRSLEKAGLQAVEHKDLDGAIVALYALEDEFAPMKAVQKFVKNSKSADSKLTIEYVGWRFDKEWKDAKYVSTLANLPSKEELVGKLLFLLKHPVQKLVGTLDAIAKKG